MGQLFFKSDHFKLSEEYVYYATHGTDMCQSVTWRHVGVIYARSSGATETCRLF
jgi:hypothetical protein